MLNLEELYLSKQVSDEEKLPQFRAAAEEAATLYNAAIAEGKFSDATDLEATITSAVTKHSDTARRVCFKECKASDDPMRTACIRLTYASIAAKDVKNDDDIVERKIVDVEKKIDLERLDKFCDGIGADKNWVHLAQKMNFLLTAQKCVDLGVDPHKLNDSYAMSEIAKSIDMGKTPTSKTNLLRTLQMVVTGMLGEEAKATSHDVNYLLSIYSKKGRKALSVSCANHKYFIGYLAEICHRIILGKAYEVEYKAKKGA